MTPRGRLAGLVDATLEASVIGGFSRIGPAVRGRVEHWADPPRLDGRVCLVTGASGGLGLAASLGMARLGASLRLLVRDAARGEDGPSPDRRARRATRTCAASSSTSRCAAPCAPAPSACSRASEPVHVLVHNAGVLPRERRETEEGLELTFATNVLGPHLLTRLLRERLIASAPARVLFVSSGGMYTRRLDVDDLQSRRGAFDGRVAYARSKRAEVVLAERWAEELAGTGVVVHAMHPGWADTPGIKTSLPGFQRIMRPAAAHARAGRRHHRLAGGGRGAGAGHRALLVRSPRARDAPARPHAARLPRIGIGSGTALDALAAGASARI